ncbi:hypothetical protein [Pseudooceanicola sp. LIPI14-2-Ac024]|uniref:hypothetical protein n=1 Tax=Pseudooceanicola sp. LIPI14-2-Ac024 TaxID=3344875 RepID=UPI0035CE939B
MTTRLLLPLPLVLLAAACAQQEEVPMLRIRGAPEPAVVNAPEVERVDEVAPEPDASGRLGSTVASLGSPSEPGQWLKTPLVDAEAQGRVVYEGRSATVTLIPIPAEVGAGSRMSLAAFQALGAPITGLPEVEVFRN